ncbi:MAG TPA: replication-associated recombination protein A [Candidatus Limnocylindrales bacterium]|nr:replication-associated recombination protein A [Candidatus Limnocylindrales bacterium]
MPTRRITGAKPEGLFQPPLGAQPLANRMRPRTLDEYVGQEHLVGPDGPLRRAVARGHLSSMYLWGPPGVGKTTLARILASSVGAHVTALSAVETGVGEMRAAIVEAQERLALNGTRTVLFIDELHRLNKGQQDALLPHVESGTVVLVGSSTENPYFEVNSALLSRLRVWRLEPLPDDAVATVVRRAIDDPVRGLAGDLGPEGGVAIADEAFDHLISLAGGDGRVALNVLEGAVALADDQGVRDAEGRVAPRLEDIEAAAQQRILAYDRAGDGHYDTVSAFIKSLRGNDPDAALYWLASMIAAGEDPKFIARRLIISASEDVGNADPRALSVAVAAADALEWIGLPEAQYALAQATTYIATAPKSNRSGQAYFAAAGDVEARGSLPVPMHLRNAGDRRMKTHGIGIGYRYPHEFEGADVEQQYLPDELVDRRYYLPTDHGYESTISGRQAARAEARAAAKARGRTPRDPNPAPEVRKSDQMRKREEARKKLAETEKKDAAG